MELKAIEGGNGRIEQSDEAMVTIAEYLNNYENGSVDALYDLGVAFSTGSHGCTTDMIVLYQAMMVFATATPLLKRFSP